MTVRGYKSIVTTALLLGLGGGTAWAQAQPATTDVGPGRIFCRSATACELDIGTPASLKYKIDPAALEGADKDRLVKHCTVKGAPCVATVTGTDAKSTIKATKIKFYN
ncbi:MAG TPA: hypothetical protein VL614_10775 [Acetobacteraceae bacterium]|jgi:hypothetical protein|nr:hypothetical protein [Acetobacteraceae bacterium]